MASILSRPQCVKPLNMHTAGACEKCGDIVCHCIFVTQKHIFSIFGAKFYSSGDICFRTRPQQCPQVVRYYRIGRYWNILIKWEASSESLERNPSFVKGFFHNSVYIYGIIKLGQHWFAAKLITLTNADLCSVGSLGTNFSNITNKLK